MSPDDAKRLFESLCGEASDQKKLAQTGNSVMSSGVGPTIATPETPNRTEHPTGLAMSTPATPGTPGTFVKEYADTGDRGNAKNGGLGHMFAFEPISLQESDDFLTVPYFWLFKLDAGKNYLSRYNPLFAS